MAIDRREFVRLGSLAAAGALGSACAGKHGPSGLSGRTLSIDIRGLCIVERPVGKGLATVHMVDALKFDPKKFMVVEHLPFLSVAASDINGGTTAMAMPDPYVNTRRVFALKDKAITLVDASGGPGSLRADDGPIGSGLPSSQGGWSSLKRAARLKNLCGGDKIIVTDRFSASATLEHGHLTAKVPDTSLGQTTIWTFVNPKKMEVVAQQAMTDGLTCTVPFPHSTATFQIGSAKGDPVVVINLPAKVFLQNLPKPNAPIMCRDGVPVCVDHLALLFDLVNKGFDPIVAHETINDRAPGSNAEPDYCPPGSI